LDSNQSEKSSKRRTAVMLDFISQFSLKSLHISDQPTFHHNNQVSESQIDHILCYLPTEDVIKINFKEILCQKVNSSNLSSHDVVIGEMFLPKPIQNNTQEPDYSNAYSDFKIQKPKWNISGMEGYKIQSAEVITELMNNFTEPSHIPALAEMCSKMLVLSAIQNFETTQPQKTPPLKKSPTFSSEHRQAYLKHESICRECRKAGRPGERSHPAKI
jgi:hypothetical protein